jgi:ribosomal protein L12E/L44/L45/RPP1/RPP2/muconolactone delta-isomerase
MSVAQVMETMATQDATESMGASIGNTGQPAGSSSTGKPVVSGIDDIFNLYDPSNDESEADKNGIELKEDKTTIPDELNNEKSKNEKKDEPKEEEKKEEEKKPEVEAKDESKQSQFPEKVKVKVNGNEIEVPLQDVINSYSGQQEIQRRFTEFDKQKKAWEKESAQEKEFSQYVKSEIGELRGSFESIIGQYQKTGFLDKDPMGAINQLLDKMGINSNMYERAVFEHNLPEYAKYFNMTDIERDAYFTRKENDYLRRKEQGFNDRDQQVKLREEKQRQDFELINGSGLDEVGYQSLSNELLEAGHKDVTAEKVVEYAKQKPTLEKVVKVFSEIGVDATQDPRAQAVFKLFSEFPDTTIEEVLDHLDPQRAAVKSAQVLQQKQPKSYKVPPQTDEDEELTEQLSYFRR